MAAYLRFYQFASSPFDGSVTKRGMVLGTQALKGALAQVKQALDEGAPRICLSGSDGLGKTSFGRALPKLLADEAQVAVTIDPSRSWEEIRARACKKFGIEGGAMSRKSLAAAREPGKRLVIVFDQAQQLSHETLDHLDILLQYKDDEGGQLVHCVMLANLDAAASGTELPLLWWLDKFTTLQLQFSPIPVEGVKHYVEKHLSKAGWAGGELFTPSALRSIHSYTGGVPGAINDLCERILVEGGVRGIETIDEEFIDALCGNDLGTPHSAKTEAAESHDEAPAEEAPELSGDVSMSDFVSGPSAQEMLDDPNAQADLDGQPDVDLRANPKEEPAPVVKEDLTSLLVTEDSAEHLHTAEEASEETAKGQAAALELEEEPEADKFADFYDEKSGPPRQLVGLSKPGSSVGTIQRPPRRTGGWVIAALVVCAIGWFGYSHLSERRELIEQAEARIEKALEQAPKLAVVKPKAKDEAKEAGVELTDETDADEAAEDAETTEVADRPRSLIDRADELVADPNANLVPVPEIALDDETARDDDAEVAETPAEEDAEVASASEPEEALASEPAPPAATTPSKPKPATTEIPSEMLVINEYTAIPEAASSAPKLPLPDAADDADDLDTAAKPEPTAPPARVDETAKPQANNAAPAPAKPAPTAATSRPTSEVARPEPASPEPASVDEARTPEPGPATHREATASPLQQRTQPQASSQPQRALAFARTPIEARAEVHQAMRGVELTLEHAFLANLRRAVAAATRQRLRAFGAGIAVDPLHHPMQCEARQRHLVFRDAREQRVDDLDLTGLGRDRECGDLLGVLRQRVGARIEKPQGENTLPAFECGDQWCTPGRSLSRHRGPGVEQQARDLVEAAFRRQLQRCAPAIVGFVDIHARIDQNADRASGTRRDRVGERRQSVDQSAIESRTPRHHGFEQLDLLVTDRKEQRGLAALVRRVHIGTCLDELQGDRAAAILGRGKQGGDPPRVARVDSCAALEQQPDHLGFTHACGVHQHRTRS